MLILKLNGCTWRGRCMKESQQAWWTRGEGLEPVRCAVVHPCEAGALRGALEAGQAGLIVPVLVGPENRIRELAQAEGIDLAGIEVVHAPYSHAAAETAVALAVQGQVEALMKGSLHTDELMHAALAERNFRTKRRLSHVFRFEVPLYDKPLLITDAALNIRPTLADKVDIVQNAILLAQILGVETPKVAILSAVETVNPAIPSTLDAAALCKMSERGQIMGAVLDGPLAFDSAISREAAAIKQIRSSVSGLVDILVVPDLESGNMLAKQLEYLAGGTASGVVLGGRVPVALTSRADGAQARIGSALLAKLVAHHQRRHAP
ncbi:MAG: bifunctional enoyl-CoA hydratase/phosphate acetyltransferase [Betaproteobacteria bacterium]|nr:bifunctional enoyl-CoA hydratase/phosphate acetyltransferase [Betaproteobacteria bacterium]